MSTTERLDRLRGYRQGLADADAAQVERLAEIDAATSRSEAWSRTEVEYWEQRGSRARRRAAETREAAWQAQLARNEPARRKAEVRIAELEEKRAEMAGRHVRETNGVHAEIAKATGLLYELEAVPELDLGEIDE